MVRTNFLSSLFQRLFLVTSISVVFASVAFSQLGGPKLRGLVVGVLSWQDKSLSPFSVELRKDKELFDIFSKSPVNKDSFALILDEKGTLKEIRQALKSLAEQSSSGETFIFYYAGHGIRGDGGKTYFANYDIVSASPKESGFCLDELISILGDTFKGNRVILLADCCYSGGLTQVARALADKGKIVLALTSAAACNASTGNWTFSQTIIDGLRGELFSDPDKDGLVTVLDLKEEVERAMRYRERQRFGYAQSGFGSDFVFAKAKELGPAAPLPNWAREKDFRPGDYLRVREITDGQWFCGRLLPGGTGEKVAVRFYEYNKNRDILVGQDQVEMYGEKTYPKGSDIRVIWGKKEWDAKVLEVENGFHWITYPGWEDYWNEWVMDDRIVGLKSEMATIRSCEVLWKEQWYKARVLREENGRYYIHYEDFDNSWDEWVTDERIRFQEGGKQ